jgi:hypothetical protein
VLERAGELAAGSDVQLAVDVEEMPLDRPHGHEQRLGDLPVRHPPAAISATRRSLGVSASGPPQPWPPGTRPRRPQAVEHALRERGGAADVRQLERLRQDIAGLRVTPGGVEHRAEVHCVDAPRQISDPDTHVDDIAWLCGRLALERPVIVGHSLGGLLALALAARHPELPAGVVALDSPLLPPPERLELMRRLFARLRGPAYAEEMAGSSPRCSSRRTTRSASGGSWRR